MCQVTYTCTSLPTNSCLRISWSWSSRSSNYRCRIFNQALFPSQSGRTSTSPIDRWPTRFGMSSTASSSKASWATRLTDPLSLTNATSLGTPQQKMKYFKKVPNTSNMRRKCISSSNSRWLAVIIWVTWGEELIIRICWTLVVANSKLTLMCIQNYRVSSKQLHYKRWTCFRLRPMVTSPRSLSRAKWVSSVSWF